MRAALILLALFVSGAAMAAPTASGIASWYGRYHEGRRMANGCPFRLAALSAASRTLPLGTVVRVISLANGRSVEVPITDRGPYIRGRVIDLSRAAAVRLDMVAAGIVAVSIVPIRVRPRAGCG